MHEQSISSSPGRISLRDVIASHGPRLGDGVIDGRNRPVKSSPTLLCAALIRFAGRPGKERTGHGCAPSRDAPPVKGGCLNLPPLKKGDRGGFSSIDPSCFLGAPSAQLRVNSAKQSGCFAAGLGLRVSGHGTNGRSQMVIARAEPVAIYDFPLFFILKPKSRNPNLKRRLPHLAGLGS